MKNSTCTLTCFAAESLDTDTDEVSRSINACTSVGTRFRLALVQIHLAKFTYIDKYNWSFYARQHICYSAYMPWQFHFDPKIVCMATSLEWSENKVISVIYYTYHTVKIWWKSVQFILRLSSGKLTTKNNQSINQSLTEHIARGAGMRNGLN